VNAGDHVGPGQNQQIVVALDVGRPVGKALATVIRLGQIMPLDHGAHAAIQDQDALLQVFLNGMEAGFCHVNRRDIV